MSKDPAKLTVRTVLQVPFHHCDPLAVVWHGHYFEYFEQARTALLDQFDLDLASLGTEGYRIFVTDGYCHYAYPLRYKDEFEVKATIVALTPLIRVAYRVTNLSAGRSCARGYTRLATTDADGNLLQQPPPSILSRLPPLGGSAK